MRSQIACVLCLCLACAAAPCAESDAEEQAFVQQMQSLHWVKGPITVSIGSNATFDVPDGFVFLGPSDTEKFMSLTENLPPVEGATVFGPSDFSWWGMYEYMDVGHVRDNDDIEPEALLATTRDNQAQANEQLSARGWPTLQVVGWQQAPFYDLDTHNLSWALDLRSSDGVEVINYNTRLLSRTGYTAATLVTDPALLQTSITQFKDVVQGYRYTVDETYAAYEPGDKVAEYGLAALITGGAAAVAVKSGLWKVIVGALAASWKFLLAGLVAFSAALRRIFKRGDSQSS